MEILAQSTAYNNQPKTPPSVQPDRGIPQESTRPHHPTEQRIIPDNDDHKHTENVFQQTITNNILKGPTTHHILPSIGGPAQPGDLILIRKPRIRNVLSIRKTLGISHPPLLLLVIKLASGRFPPGVMNITHRILGPTKKEKKDIDRFKGRVLQSCAFMERNARESLDPIDILWPIRGFVDEGSEVYVKPGWEVVRKVMMGDKCHVQGCREGEGLVERAGTYERVRELGEAMGEDDVADLVRGGAYGGRMLCPDCHGVEIVVEDEKLEAGLLRWGWPRERREKHAREVSKRRQELGYTMFPVGRAVHVADFNRPGQERAIAVFPLHRTENGPASLSSVSWALPPTFTWQFDGPAYQVRDYPLPLLQWQRLKKRVVRGLGKEEMQGDSEICLMGLKDREAEGQGWVRLVELRCGHRYHEGCVGTWFARKDRCPDCRVRVGV